MEIVLKVCAAALTAALSALVLKKQAPEQAMLLSLACGALILWMLSDAFGEFARAWDRLALRVPYADEILPPLFKALGISVLTHFSAELCRDGGQSALAARVELAGSAGCVLVMLPLAERALELIGEML